MEPPTTPAEAGHKISEAGLAFYASFLPEPVSDEDKKKKKLIPSNRYYTKLPLVYSTEYNISFLGLEKLHPFDSCKYQNVMKFLVETHKLLQDDHVTRPIRTPKEEELLEVHTKQYLESLSSSYNVAAITEMPFIAVMPNFLVRSRVLNPMLYATSGTIVSAMLAVQNGWSINLGGGFHHCCAYQGGGFCPYSDITMCYRFLRKFCPTIRRVMIVDLDAHQGNGHERDKLHFKDQELTILDVYNPRIYPGDVEALVAIDVPGRVPSGSDSARYIKTLKECLQTAADDFPKPDFVIFNAGTDILAGDPLGCLDVSPAGVVERDEIVFTWARSRNIPITMVLSGGYQRTNAEVIANSLNNLHTKGLIDLTLDPERKKPVKAAAKV